MSIPHGAADEVIVRLPEAKDALHAGCRKCSPDILALIKLIK